MTGTALVAGVRPAGDAALLLDVQGHRGRAGEAGPAVAAALATAIWTAGLPGVTDVVPGAATVLVSFEPGSWSTADLGGRLAALVPTAESGPGGAVGPDAVTEIDVCYDGPDLADVAALTGLGVPEVIERHQAGRYRVGWLGFSPGFGYLTGLDPVLASVPRLATPRLSVPAGSVAIAGGYAAVYPANSPGGWRLLGRTNAVLWDAGHHPPAALAPGMAVRFRAVAELPAGGPGPSGRPGAQSTPPAARASSIPARKVAVLQPGPLTTIQDLGRPGLAHLGVPRSGAADPGSLLLANELVGNEPGAAALEVTLGRLVLRWQTEAVAALAGAPVPIRVTAADGHLSQPDAGTAFAVPAGATLRLGAPTAGLRSYLAIGGGVDAPRVLGSRSSDLLSGIGPGPLRSGDVLRLGQPRSRSHKLSAARPRPGLPALPAPAAEVELTVIAGPRDDWFTPAALAALTSGSYQVTAASNRTGLRLTGPPLRRSRPAELRSEGTATGSLQVTSDGQPILLLADHPTTGGYPVIAVVRSADIGLAAQLRPGQRVRFAVRR